MKRKIMVVTAAYGYEQVRAAGGQTAMLPIIAEAGADGVEIRREMLTDTELTTLSTMASAIEIFGLLACYSAPEPLFLEDGNLNPRLPALLAEAQALQALWLKVSLGHFSHTGQFDVLRTWLADSGWSWLSKTIRPPADACSQCSALTKPARRKTCRYR